MAVVLGVANTAFADEHACSTSVPFDDHQSSGPALPTDVAIDLGVGLSGGHGVSTLLLTGSFGPTTTRVKITLIDFAGEPLPTAPVVVVDPRDHERCLLPAVFDNTLATVEAIDAAGHRGALHTIGASNAFAGGCGLGATVQAAFEWFFVIGLFALISFVAIMRRIRRGTNGEVPIVISLVLAETLARRARSRDGIVAVLLTAAAIVAWTMYGNWVVIGSVWILLCIGDYGVATYAVSILERPNAVAELYGTNLVVRAEDHTSAILLSRRAIKRAKRDALPRALLQ